MTDAALSIEAASALYGEGELDGAEHTCDELLGSDPTDGEALNLKGLIAYRRGDHEAAVDWLSKASAAPNARAGFFNNLGELLRQIGDLERAEGALAQAIAMEPSNAVALNNLGLVLLARGKNSVAMERLNQAAECDAEYADVRNNLATAYLAHGDVPAAEQHVRKALSLGPAKAEYHHNLGLVLEDRDDMDGAIEAYQQALSLDHRDEASFENLCALLFEREETNVVSDLCGQLQEMAPDLAYPYFHAGKAALLSKDQSAAETALRHYLDRAPDDPLGAELLLASQGAVAAPTQAGEAFLKNFYRGRAQMWDGFVAGDYHGHDIILERLSQDFGWPTQIGSLLDLGCGTGALGEKLRDSVERLDGVDISPEMVQRAETKAIYDRLQLDEAGDFLAAVDKPYDIVVAAAILFHFRDLDEIFAAIAGALVSGGGFVFTVFKTDTLEPELNVYNLYLHSRDYLERTLPAAGFGEIVVSEHIHEYERKTIPRYCLAVSCRKL